VSRNVSQAKVATAVSVGQSGMIHTKQMQDRGMEVVHVNRIVHDSTTEFVASPT